jgi:phosphate starvation-inducible PhoH-like protein
MQFIGGYNLNKFKIEDTSVGELNEVFGIGEEHLQLLEQHFDVEMVLRGDELHIFGDVTIKDKVSAAVEALRKLYKKGQHIASHDVTYLLRASESEKADEKLAQVIDARSEIGKTQKGKSIYAKTINQCEYFAKIQKNDLVFGIGPAGCGKTYLAVVIGVMMMKRGEVERMVITRPVVEAGESLGFLPGDLKEKVDPYLRPIYDAFHDVLGVEVTEKMMSRGQIEIAPLAYMRGRTLENAYVVLDEAQNTTKEQMKMFLTRLGENSKMVVTGDITQIDLPKRVTSGLVHVGSVLKDVEGIEFVEFETIDVVRHPLVQKIIERYISADKEEKNK